LSKRVIKSNESAVVVINFCNKSTRFLNDTLINIITVLFIMCALVELDDIVEEFVAERVATDAEKEVSTMIKLVQNAGLLQVVKKEEKGKKFVKKINDEEVESFPTVHKKVERKQSFFYSSHFEDYNPFLMNHFYSNVDVYELHYGDTPNQNRAQQDEEEIEKKRSTNHKMEVKEESNEKMKNTIQRIIYAKLTGGLSDVSIEDRERFKNWRQFHKYLRRMHEGAFYASSVTKSIL
jgi:type II secretory ATPase GspE/PulE/Tfp pilus assembly ATPase PilB-like protein